MTEWIEVNQPWGEVEGVVCKPGVQVEVERAAVRLDDLGRPSKVVEVYLVGDLNKGGGVCGCCSAFGNADVVVRYRVVIGEGGGVAGEEETDDA